MITSRLTRQITNEGKQGKQVTQGIYINGKRPKSKKEVKEAIQSNPDSVAVEATSMFGNEYEGTVSAMPNGVVVFVGPDPYTRRTFYGRIVRTDKGISVK